MDREMILKAAAESIIESDEDKALEVLTKADEAGINPVELLSEGFSAGMGELGDQFGRGEIFLPELIFATEVMKVVTEKIESKLESKDTQKKGVMVIGTVAGDVHDIGKGIVASLVKTNGIEVHDLGREVPAEEFIAKAIEYKADFIGSSALLTTTMTEQKKIEDLLNASELKDNTKTLVGGAPVTNRWAERIGADAYCEDASEAVKVLVSWLSN